MYWFTASRHTLAQAEHGLGQKKGEAGVLIEARNHRREGPSPLAGLTPEQMRSSARLCRVVAAVSSDTELAARLGEFAKEYDRLARAKELPSP